MLIFYLLNVSWWLSIGDIFLKNKRVLVIGDGCDDVYWYGSCNRLCPEAPVPVFTPINSVRSGGMAVNVYNNLVALGVDADIITSSGITKTRYVDVNSNQMLLRVDENDRVDGIPWSRLTSIQFDEYRAVVISDYNKGFLSEDDIEYITARHSLVFMDTKKKWIGDWAKGVEYIKINKAEYDDNYHGEIPMFPYGLIVTIGSSGARFISNRFESVSDIYFPVEKEVTVRDVSGAGDTFLAGLVAAYIQGNDVFGAITFANRCASWAVGQKGVVVVNRTKIDGDEA